MGQYRPTEQSVGFHQISFEQAKPTRQGREGLILAAWGY